MQNKLGDKNILIFFGIALLAVGIIAGFFVSLAITSKSTISPKLSTTTSGGIRADLSEYHFINPLLYSENAKSSDPKMNDFESTLSTYISSIEKGDPSSHISVYFRDLDSGAWTGVGEDETYTPSSMLKIVAMMAALKESETDPNILSEKLYMTRTPAGHELFVPDDTYESGYYTLQDLIDIMIRYSDNDALNAIVSDPKIKDEYTEIFTLMRLPLKNSNGSEIDFMSPRSFSALFRSLYNSSFFQWDVSEHVLSLLSETTFSDGIVAGVPAGTSVAHKFGENTDELHDCGIVYYPDNPYLLCVMTKGSSFKTLENAIAGISKLSYQFVDVLHKNSSVAKN